MFPDISKILGSKIKDEGNIVHILKIVDNITIVSYPVKHEQMIVQDIKMVVPAMRSIFGVGSMCPGWALCADPLLIVRSAHQLIKLVDENNIEFCCLPRPGCGAGNLEWSEIKPLLSPILDDRFQICHWKKEG